MPTDFRTIADLYNSNRFVELVQHPNGIYWLKLRSVSRTKLLRMLCERMGIDHEKIESRRLFVYVYDCKPNTRAIDEFIKDVYEQERSIRRRSEDQLISELYQVKVFDWGGLYQNSLERTIINNYVKRIREWKELNKAIDGEIHLSMQGYVRCS